MTHHNDHDHGHSHDHDHNHDQGNSNDHGHEHTHGNGLTHSHDHGHSYELTFEQKLEKLFSHWIDHNDSHKDTFYTWAGRAKKAGLDKIAANIEKAGELSKEVTQQLRDALNQLKG